MPEFSRDTRRTFFPVGNRSEEQNVGIIHDLMFAVCARARSSSVNADDAGFGQAPACLVGHVMSDALSRVLSLQQLHGRPQDIIFLLSRTDVIGEAFREAPVDPSGAAVFLYLFDGDGHVVADL